MDPDRALAGGLLAYLYDREGWAVGRRFHARDAVDLRSALAPRWRERESALAAEEVRFWLVELWARQAAGLPERGLRKLGGIWPHAGAFLARLRPGDRTSGLDALDALPDSTKLEALLARDPEPRSDPVRLLRLRVHLMRGEAEAATRLLDERLAELVARGAFVYEPVPASPRTSDEEGLGVAAGRVVAGEPRSSRGGSRPVRPDRGPPLARAMGHALVVRRGGPPCAGAGSAQGRRGGGARPGGRTQPRPVAVLRGGEGVRCLAKPGPRGSRRRARALDGRARALDEEGRRGG